MNGSGTLGGTTQGGHAGNRFWEGNNSGGFSSCILNCTAGGASWTSRQGGWTSDTQNFALPVNIFHGGIPGGDDCSPSGASTGCGHLLAGTTRVLETITGATATNTWYVTNNPIDAEHDQSNSGQSLLHQSGEVLAEVHERRDRRNERRQRPNRL